MKRLASTLFVPARTGAATAVGPMEHLGGAFAAAAQLHAIPPVQGATGSSSTAGSCETSGLAAASRATSGSEPLVASPAAHLGLSTPPLCGLDYYSTAGLPDADSVAVTTANSCCTAPAYAGEHTTAIGATSVVGAGEGAGPPHARGHASMLRGAAPSTVTPTGADTSGRTAAAYLPNLAAGSRNSTATAIPTIVAPYPYGIPAGRARPTRTQPAWPGLPGALPVRNRLAHPWGACRTSSQAACISASTKSGAAAVPALAATAQSGRPLAAAAVVAGIAARVPASAPPELTSGLEAAAEVADPVRRRGRNSDPGAGAGAHVAREGAGAEGGAGGGPNGGTTRARRSRSPAATAATAAGDAAAKGSQTPTAVKPAQSAASSSNCNNSSSSGASAMASPKAAATDSETVTGAEAGKGAGAGAGAGGHAGAEIEVHDPEGIHVGSLGVAGGSATWYQRHVAQVAAAAAAGHSAGLGPPGREDFELQLLLENSCRHTALREARQRVSELRAEGRLEEAPPARRLLDAWVPQLAGRVAAAVEKYLLLEHQRTIRKDKDKKRSASRAPPLAAASATTTPASPSQPGTPPNRAPAELQAAAMEHSPAPSSSSSSHSLSPSVNVTIAPSHRELESPDFLPSEPPHTPATPSTPSAPHHVVSPADMLLASSRIRSTSEERAALLARVMDLRALSRFAPHVLCVPPQLVARATVAAVLNGLILRDVAESTPSPPGGELDLPPGTGLSMHIAENLGRRVMEMVSYMQVSEAVLAKTKELREAEAALRRTQKVLEEEWGQQGQGQQRGDTEGQLDGMAQHSTGGASVALYDEEVAAAAARVTAARAALRQLQKAASLLQPASVPEQGLKPQGHPRWVVPLADLLPTRSSKAATPTTPTTTSAATTGPTNPRDSVDAADGDLASSLLSDLSKEAAAVAAGAEVKGAPGRARALRVGGKLVKDTADRRLLKVVVERAKLAGRVQDWDISTRVQIGSSLLALALATLEVPAAAPGAPPEPAFSHSTAAAGTLVRGSYQTPGLVVAHPHVLEMLEGDEELRRLLRPRFLPMVVEPRPWSGVRRGGFLTQTSPVMKTRYSPLILHRLHEAHGRGALGPLYGGLTALGSVPWRINTRVLDVMNTIVEGGGGVLGLPPRANHPLPPRPSAVLNPMYKALLGREPPGQCGTPHLRLQREGPSGGQLLVGAGPLAEAEEWAYQRQCNLVRLANRTAAGQRCMLKHRLDLARQYSGRYDLATLYGTDTMDVSQYDSSLASGSGQPVMFFQPHNVDFRGRAYTLHPHLTHLADDPARGLLQFGVGRPLGDRGFRWLLVQVANLWGRGVDKLPFDERVAWARQQLPAIRASAARPLEPAGGAGSWWRQGEKPWQLLATCFEIDEALASGSPEAYVSFQPVLQDGTCNGLQHYAALARDEVCGAAVNLLPADKPGDVYTAVAEAVARRVAEDAAAGRSEASKADGLVDRKLVKQTVMTYVYGVTIIGAREQMESRLEERAWGSQRERRKVATYLAALTFKSMGDVFGPAVAVRSWLTNCAKAIATTGLPVMWTAPLGYPVEQPYREVPYAVLATPLQNFRVRDMSGEADAPVDKRRQRTAFAPNYIHSLDGSHMLATAARVREAGACFAAVHDSFWTHAATVDLMGRALRDTFVEMHSRPLLSVLAAEVEANPVYKAARVKVPRLPPTGRLDLAAVRDAPYFFS